MKIKTVYLASSRRGDIGKLVTVQSTLAEVGYMVYAPCLAFAGGMESEEDPHHKRQRWFITYVNQQALNLCDAFVALREDVIAIGVWRELQQALNLKVSICVLDLTLSKRFSTSLVDVKVFTELNPMIDWLSCQK